MLYCSTAFFLICLQTGSLLLESSPFLYPDRLAGFFFICLAGFFVSTLLHFSSLFDQKKIFIIKKNQSGEFNESND